MSLKSLSPLLVLAVAGGAFLVYYNGGVPGVWKADTPLSDLTSADRTFFATPATGTQNAPRRDARDNNPGGPPVDESAIHYYALQQDWDRMRAEIARLKVLYPNWIPPESHELGRTPLDPDTQELWSLFSKGNYPAVRNAIAARRQSDPQWTPPAELLTQLADGEARQRLVNAGKSQQWETVIRVANEHESILTCANVEALWTIAEAFIKTNENARGLDVYTYILNNCSNEAERLATVVKAASVLPLADAEQLVAAHPEEPFAEARDVLVRRRMGIAAQDTSSVASAADLTRMEQIVSTTPVTADDAMLLAFYLYHHGNPARAAQLFRTALDNNGGAKAAEGYVLAMSAQRLYLDAEPVAYEWRDAGPDNMKAYLDLMTTLLSQEPPPRLDESIVNRFVPVVVQQQSSLAGQALGWYAYNTGQILTAERWFTQSLRWDRESEPSAFGLAVARQRLKNTRGFAAVVNAWRDRSQRIDDLARGRNRRGVQPTTSLRQQNVDRLTADDRELFGDVPATGSAARRAISAREPAGWQDSGGDVRVRTAAVSDDTFDAPRVQRVSDSPRRGRGCSSASSMFNLQALSSTAAINLGWCLMDLDRPLEAAQAFDVALAKSTSATRRGEAAYGKSFAYLKAGLTSEAAVAASNARVSPARERELRIALLTQQASAAYDAGRYADAIFSLDARRKLASEQTSLMVMRAWAYFNLSRLDEAERIFRVVERSGASTDAAKGLTAIADRRGLNKY